MRARRGGRRGPAQSNVPAFCAQFGEGANLGAAWGFLRGSLATADALRDRALGGWPAPAALPPQPCRDCAAAACRLISAQRPVEARGEDELDRAFAGLRAGDGPGPVAEGGDLGDVLLRLTGTNQADVLAAAGSLVTDSSSRGAGDAMDGPGDVPGRPQGCRCGAPAVSSRRGARGESLVAGLIADAETVSALLRARPASPGPERAHGAGS